MRDLRAAYVQILRIQTAREIAEIVSQSRNRVLLDSGNLLMNFDSMTKTTGK